jgi:hypothetical protein
MQIVIVGTFYIFMTVDRVLRWQEGSPRALCSLLRDHWPMAREAVAFFRTGRAIRLPLVHAKVAKQEVSVCRESAADSLANPSSHRSAPRRRPSRAALSQDCQMRKKVQVPKRFQPIERPIHQIERLFGFQSRTLGVENKAGGGHIAAL